MNPIESPSKLRVSRTGVAAAIVEASRAPSAGEAALVYARAGIAVFPCRSNKRPWTAHGYLDATADLGQVERWWRRWPTALVGLPTGRFGGRAWSLVVLDIDPRNGGRIDPRVDRTFTVATPSGGVHLYFASERDLSSLNGVISDGVDRKAAGGYVAAPGSSTYSVVRELPIAAWPAWIDNLLGDRKRPARGGRGGRGGLGPQVRLGEPISAGNRNGGLASVAGSLLVRGAEPHELAELLLRYNARYCEPPLDDSEVERIAASIARTAAREEADFSSSTYRDWRSGEEKTGASGLRGSS